MRARITLVAIPLALLSLSACGGADREKETGGASSSGKGSASTSVEVAGSGLGDILVDQDGRTLYAFTKDKAGAGSCDADCIAVWPALTSTAAATAGPGTDKALLGEARNAGGAVQATYGDWPLYYYVGDAAPGDVNGQGLDGEWFVVKADGKMIKE